MDPGVRYPSRSGDRRHGTAHPEGEAHSRYQISLLAVGPDLGPAAALQEDFDPGLSRSEADLEKNYTQTRMIGLAAMEVNL